MLLPAPSTQTGRADFPHPAFRSAQLCSFTETGEFLGLGGFQAEVPTGVKVPIWPAWMVQATGPPPALAPLAQSLP
jgi:hypothetical protein